VIRTAAVFAFIGTALAGTMLDVTRPVPGSPSLVMTADLHVHPYPGDGALPVWELQREAARRGVDVIAVTGHNNRLGLDIGRLVPLDPAGPIVLPGQEVTMPTLHVIAVGIEELIDWRLPTREVIAAIHAQGGVAIAAHPIYEAWMTADVETVRALDGAEIAHPVSLGPWWVGARLRGFFRHAQSLNPDIAPIGSTDFHMTAPLGLCRTYLLVDERSADGALDAIRRGRSVARDAEGRLFGASEHVAAVERHLAAAGPAQPVPLAQRLLALAALLSLAGLTGLRAPRVEAQKVNTER
jgi:hypothetical protein